MGFRRLGEPLREKKKTCHDFAGIESPGCDVSLGNVRQREHAEEGLIGRQPLSGGMTAGAIQKLMSLI